MTGVGPNGCCKCCATKCDARHRLHLTASSVVILAQFAKLCVTINLKSCHPGAAAAPYAPLHPFGVQARVPNRWTGLLISIITK
jgi:hypothetical protein